MVLMLRGKGIRREKEPISRGKGHGIEKLGLVKDIGEWKKIRE